MSRRDLPSSVSAFETHKTRPQSSGPFKAVAAGIRSMMPDTVRAFEAACLSARVIDVGLSSKCLEGGSSEKQIGRRYSKTREAVQGFRGRRIFFVASQCRHSEKPTNSLMLILRLDAATRMRSASVTEQRSSMLVRSRRRWVSRKSRA